jgi:hypothetical protein
MHPSSRTVGAFTVLALGLQDEWCEVTFVAGSLMPVEWYVFADPRAILNPALPALLRQQGATRPDIDIFYGDVVVTGQPPRYVCKPSFDRTQLLAQDYIGLPFAVRGTALAALSGIDPKMKSAQCYDLLLRAAAAETGIDRITEVLAVNPPDGFAVSAADRLVAVQRYLALNVPGCDVAAGLIPGSLELRRTFDAVPDVTLVIPTRQQGRPGAESERPMIVGLLEGLCATDWPMERLTVLIGDDRPDGAIYETRDWPFRLSRVVSEAQPSGGFNYARKVNALLQLVETEHLVVMNDDLLILEPRWLKALMTFAVDEDVGGVGARLLYPDGRIQHAGMAAGVFGGCTHVFIGADPSLPTYENWAVVQRECSIVTGAVFATRRSLMRQVNGFDERFSLDYNDIDLCLRLRQLGFRIVYTPHAELIHFESATRRGLATPDQQTDLFLRKWQDYIAADPFYHPNLTRTDVNVHAVMPDEAWWRSVAMREANA